MSLNAILIKVNTVLFKIVLKLENEWERIMKKVLKRRH